MKKLNYFNWRFFLIMIFLIASVIAIFIRVIYLQIDKENFLKNWGQNQHIAYREVPSIRGTIYDRNNIPLAISLTHYDLYALRNFSKDDYVKLQNIINIDTSFEKIAAKNKKILIQKSLSPDVINLIKNSSLHHYEIEIRFSRHSSTTFLYWTT